MAVLARYYIYHKLSKFSISVYLLYILNFNIYIHFILNFILYKLFKM